MIHSPKEGFNFLESYSQGTLYDKIKNLPWFCRRKINSLVSVFEQISEWEDKFKDYDQDQLKQNTDSFKQRIKEGESLDSLLPEAFATVKVACQRLTEQQAKIIYNARNEQNDLVQIEKPWNMVPFDVQVLGGILLHGYQDETNDSHSLYHRFKEFFFEEKKLKGNVVEMVTGEGKTLTATLPVYLNALTGKGVHVVTVNDYLAQRDRDWMAPLYEFLGLSVGALQDSVDDKEERKKQYDCDVTYGTNSGFGFDYLKDNLALSKESQMQRGRHFAIVDEVDSILIDEARTPHIMSGGAFLSDSLEQDYVRAQQCFDQLIMGEKKKIGDQEIETGDYTVVFGRKEFALTEQGLEKAINFLNVDDQEFGEKWWGLINNAINANVFLKLNHDYIIGKNENSKGIIIVDEFTGRLSPGRRWGKGLHEAVEAKETKNGVEVKKGHGTLASVTLQNYFKMYEKLSGMTGTALSSSDEFWKVYGMETFVLPTNLHLIRTNHDDLVYFSRPEKLQKLVELAMLDHSLGRPVLIGTTSIEESEELHEIFSRIGVKNIKVLNARPENASLEVETLSNAGKYGSFVIATNMAGRGADIVLEEGLFEKVAKNYRKLVEQQIAKDGGIELVAHNKFEYDLLLKTVEGLNREGDVASKGVGVFGKPRSVIVNSDADDKLTKKENASFLSLGFEVGLAVYGTQRHESRSIDNQLRGRTGRQGDPGSSLFLLSLDDPLLKHFVGEGTKNSLKRFGLGQGEAISHGMINRSVRRAQRKVEEFNADIRKHVLEYDEPVDVVRKFIYGIRQQVIEGRLDDFVLACGEKHAQKEGISFENFKEDYCFLKENPVIFVETKETPESERKTNVIPFSNVSTRDVAAQIAEITNKTGLYFFNSVSLKQKVLAAIDMEWRSRLEQFDFARDGIGLVGYAQLDPLVEFKKRVHEDNQLMLDDLSRLVHDTVSMDAEIVRQAIKESIKLSCKES